MSPSYATTCLDAGNQAVNFDERGLPCSASYCSIGAWDDVIYADRFGD